MNTVRFTIEIDFRGETVKPHEELEIAQNVLNALVRHIEQGNGIAPVHAEYLTEYIRISNIDQSVVVHANIL